MKKFASVIAALALACAPLHASAQSKDETAAQMTSQSASNNAEKITPGGTTIQGVEVYKADAVPVEYVVLGTVVIGGIIFAIVQSMN